MKRLKRYGFFLFIFVLLIFLLQSEGCIKEYSFERTNRDTIPLNDTLSADSSVPPAIIPQCALCKSSDSLRLGQWSFKAGNTYLCGSFSNSGFFAGAGRTNFTFFGPSACSVDTGIVVSVYLPVPLDQDRFNIVAANTAFYYYNHNGTQDIFQSRPAFPFSVTVESYIRATNIITGSFAGTVVRENGDTAYIADGRFIAPLH
jgi:hypothetical protein